MVGSARRVFDPSRASANFEDPDGYFELEGHNRRRSGRNRSGTGFLGLNVRQPGKSTRNKFPKEGHSWNLTSTLA